MPRKSVTRKAKAALHGVSSRLPHPSWHWALQGGDGAGDRVRSAEEFWNRLGI